MYWEGQNDWILVTDDRYGLYRPHSKHRTPNLDHLSFSAGHPIIPDGYRPLRVRILVDKDTVRMTYGNPRCSTAGNPDV